MEQEYVRASRRSGKLDVSMQLVRNTYVRVSRCPAQNPGPIRSSRGPRTMGPARGYLSC